MPCINVGVCEKCRKRVPSEHLVKDGKVYISKACPECGTTQALVSTDAITWQKKRDIWQYDPACADDCNLDCNVCGRKHHPRMVFVDVTNRCNMNCPICIANIPSMGFDFNPPKPYFDKVFNGLAAMPNPPTVLLFGGEPTVRADLFDIIGMARERGLRVRIVTNGVRLADEDYCRRLCETNTPLLVAFDGRSPEIYEKLRKNAPVYGKKLKAIENLKKHSKRRNTFMCCVARKINDTYIRDLIDFCHENRDIVCALHLIPLTETWKEDEFETDVSTTIEDVEKIVQEAIPEEKMEFIPAGLAKYVTRSMEFFGGVRLTFGAVHPNCESMTLLLSDGERYHALGRYLNRPLDDIAAELVTRAKRVEARLEALDHTKWFQRQRGRWLVLRTFGGLAWDALNKRAVFRGNWFLATLRVLGGLLVGRSLKHQLRRHTNIQDVMRMVVLPFEEYHSIDGARLQLCKAGFAYEDPDSGEVRTVPVCAWSLFKVDIQRKLAAKYGIAHATDRSPVAAMP
jgi:7,8-dihydro-6-hydroxymethylpterin dimethyltransferase